MKRILIAGIGNIFLGDDAFGVEVVRELSKRSLPAEVEVKDFGIRSYDLAYALGDSYDVAILVDAISRGDEPGTVYLLEPDLTDIGRLDPASVDGHSMGPVRMLQMAEALGGHPPRLYLVGCEPAELDPDPDRLGLTSVVTAAIPGAIELIQSLVRELVDPKAKVESRAVAA